MFVCVLLVAVKCSWYQLPSVSRKEAAFVEKGAFEELCVLIIDVRHSLKCLIKVIHTFADSSTAEQGALISDWSHSTEL